MFSACLALAGAFRNCWGLLALALFLSPASCGLVNARGFPTTQEDESGGLHWHSDYAAAYATAKREGRMLLVNFTPRRGAHAQIQQQLDAWIESNQHVRSRLREMVLARVSDDCEIKEGGTTIRLLDHAAFQQLAGPGIVMVDLIDADQSHYGQVVTVLPFAPGKYYRWRNSNLSAALDLPAGTLSQRTMVWAVRIHEEGPQSTAGVQHAVLSQEAAAQSTYQAEIGVQGHHRWEIRSQRIRASVPISGAKEVVAESWPGENLIDACIDCVASWRQSPGHWQAVRQRHRLFGYDIRRGRNGIWYGTGIFAN